MKQDILILSSRKDHVEPAYTALGEHDIPTLIVTDGNSGDRRKVCVNDKKGQYEKQRLSQEWK